MIFQNKIETMYKKMLFSRCDDNGSVFYFSSEDFEGLNKEPFVFKTSKGHKLQGYFYHYEVKFPDRVVVFEHGMGGGHRSYMREIEALARHGYLVFAYDHTGCMESEGESTNGFAGSLSDLDACITALKAHPIITDKKISVVGHSWGAFSTMNIVALHPEIDHIVALCGFISVEAMVNQNFSGLLKGYRKGIMEIERQANPDFYSYNACESLKNTSSTVLLIYSSDDKLVNAKMHYEPLMQALEGKKNIRIILTQGKGHNPNYTSDAVRYKDDFFKALTKKQKKGMLRTDEQRQAFKDSYDWYKMTEQDELIWQEIFNSLDS